MKVQDRNRLSYWIKSDHLTDRFECATVVSNSVNTRRAPSTAAPRVDDLEKLNKGFSAKVTDKKTNWVQLQDSEGRTFWVFRKLLWIK